MVGLGVVGVLGLNAMNQMKYREISWREFVSQHLGRGTVSKLEVINNKWVKIYSNSSVSGEVMWFSIGSLDTFERNLEAANHSLDLIPPELWQSHTSQRWRCLVFCHSYLPSF